MNTDHADLEVGVSFIDNANDNRPVIYDLKWNGMVNLLSRSDERMEKDGRAFVPVMFGDREYVNSKTGEGYSGIYRRGVAVEYVSMAVADYDDGFTIEDASELWKDHEFVIYSSHSNSPSHHKFRVVLPLAEPVKAEEWPSAWLHFFDMASVDGHRIDRKCKDLPHFYYLPSHRPGTAPVYIHNRGSLLSLPITAHPSEAATQPSAAQSWKKRHPLRQQRGGLSLDDWLVQEGVAFDLGSHAQYGTVYRLHECPWSSAHTGKKDGIGHAAVFERDDKWCFSCCHDHCAERSWADFRQHVSPKVPRSNDLRLTFGKRKAD
jgi:hypothetical protein